MGRGALNWSVLFSSLTRAPTLRMMCSTLQRPEGPQGWFPWRWLAALLVLPTEGREAHTHTHTHTHAHFSVRQIGCNCDICKYMYLILTSL